jgi:putative cardiolipin synthase
MHNKSFTADNQVSVVGGRNIANEYFGLGSGIGFADIDVLAVGPVVQEVSIQFDLYWNSASAYAAAAFVGAAAPDAAASLQAHFAATQADPLSIDYIKAVRETSILADMLNQRLPFEWTTAQVLYDAPAKTLDRTQRTDVLLFPALMGRLGRPEKSFDIVSPYFVPGNEGTVLLVELARREDLVRVPATV